MKENGKGHLHSFISIHSLFIRFVSRLGVGSGILVSKEDNGRTHVPLLVTTKNPPPEMVLRRLHPEVGEMVVEEAARLTDALP